MKKLLVAFAALTLSLSACAPVGPTPQPTSAAPTQSVQTPAPTVVLTEPPVSGGGFPPAVFAAQKILSEQLAVPADQVQVSGIEPADWPDSCLGLGRPEELCAEAITPGFRVNLTVNQAQYTFRVSADGINIRQEPSITPDDSGEQAVPVLLWQSRACEQFSVTFHSAFFGPCNGSLAASPDLATSAVAKVQGWMLPFAPFEADTKAGKVAFKGAGKLVASPAEQRMMAEWARFNYDVAQSGRAGVAWGLAFSYHREGGIAGFCDDVGVYLTGYATVYDCKGMNVTLDLTASDLALVYGWYDGFSPVDYSHTDPASADAMTIVIDMPGAGSVKADDATVQAIDQFSAGLVARAAASQQVDPAALKAAENAIYEYLDALNNRDFITGAKLYGGDPQILEDWNPDIKNDLPAWLERGCTQNGLVCLQPRSLTYLGQDAEGVFQFLVEYVAQDGTLFQRGPCCGATSGPIETNFLVRVKPQGDLWLVLDLPPYVP